MCRCLLWVNRVDFAMSTLRPLTLQQRTCCLAIDPLVPLHQVTRPVEMGTEAGGEIDVSLLPQPAHLDQRSVASSALRKAGGPSPFASAFKRRAPRVHAEGRIGPHMRGRPGRLPL